MPLTPIRPNAPTGPIYWGGVRGSPTSAGHLPFSDSVGFVGIDDSNDSFNMQFASPLASAAAGSVLAAPTFDDSDPMDWDLARLRDDDDQDGEDEENAQTASASGRVAFRASPSEPAWGTRRAPAMSGRELPRLASAPPLPPPPPRQPPPPPPASSSEESPRRASFKRPSPVALAAWTDECDDAQQPQQLLRQQSGGGTPKRRRLSRPLGDISNSSVTLSSAAAGSAMTPPPPASVSKKAACLHRCASEMSGLSSSSSSHQAVATLDSARVDKAIASIDSLNLIGNSEQQHSLPTVKELNYGIRYVTGATVSQLVNGHFTESVSNYAIIDCRYPYEFTGGHIQGAVNICTQEQLQQVLEPACSAGLAVDATASRKPVLIFHCEFSSERAPKLARFLRQRDREANAANYPDLYFPEVYVLQGGYKSFYEAHKADCQPQSYVKMVDPNHKAELANFQRASKAWERQHSRSRHTQLELLAANRFL